MIGNRLLKNGIPLAFAICCLSGGGWSEVHQDELPPAAPIAPWVEDRPADRAESLSALPGIRYATRMQVSIEPEPSPANRDLALPTTAPPSIPSADSAPVSPAPTASPSPSTTPTATTTPSPTTASAPATTPSPVVSSPSNASSGDTADTASERLRTSETAPQVAAERTQVAAERSGTADSTSTPDGDPGDTGERSSTSNAQRADRPISSEPVPEALLVAPQTTEPAKEQVRSVPAAQSRLPLDAKSQFLRDRLVRCLQFYYQKNLNTGEVSAWSIMHAALSFGADSRVHRDGPQGPLVNALGWLCWNGTCRDRKMMAWEDNRLVVREGPGFQGHPAQFLAILAQCQVGRDFELRVDGHQLAVRDLVEREMATCRPDMELTFKLIGLSHYLASDTTWTSEDGEVWTIPRLIEIELASPLNGAACGGTHRLMSISYAARRREMRNEPMEGAWLAAKQRVREQILRTYSLQNPDGSFSSQWYQRKADWGDTDRKLQTTGHMLEWLVFSLPDDQLNDPRVVRSVSFLTELMINNRYYEWENGPRGHAIRALMLYAQRRFGLQVKDYTSRITMKGNGQTQR